MTSPDERAINTALALLGDEYAEEREAARTALHHVNGKRHKLEAALREIAESETKATNLKSWYIAIARRALEAKG